MPLRMTQSSFISLVSHKVFLVCLLKFEDIAKSRGTGKIAVLYKKKKRKKLSLESNIFRRFIIPLLWDNTTLIDEVS